MSDLPNHKEEITIKEIYFLILKYYKIFSSSIISCFLISLLYIFIVHPTYESEGSILIEDPQEDVSNIFEVGLGKTKNFIENEMEILKSRTNSEQVIKQIYLSGNQLYILQNRSNDNGFLKSIFNKNYYIDNMVLTDSLLSEFSEYLRNSMVITNSRDTDVLKISIQSKDPEEAAILVNAIIDVYKQRDLSWATGEMQHLKQFLKEQLSIKEVELNNIEEKLKNFQETQKVFSINDNYSLLLNELRQLESNYYNFEAEINILKSRKDFMYNQLSKDEKNLAISLANAINSRLDALRNEIASKEAELIKTVNQRGENHEAVLSIKDKISRLKSKLKVETNDFINNGISVSDPLLYRQEVMDSLIKVESMIPNIESQKNEYKKLIIGYEKQLSELPEKVLEYTRLERIRNIQSETYSFMRQKLEEARINEASKIGKIRIVDNAVANYIPIKPNKKLYLLLSLILGSILGLSIIAIIEFFDNTIKSIEQIERRGYSLLAVIPSIGSNGSKRKTRKYIAQNNQLDKIERRLITHEDPKSPISEAYRGLRTSLMYTKSSDDCRVILVSSAGPGEGKTTTIANLAITYANLGKKTLLIDSDLRKPVVHNIFKVDKSPGLTSYLSNNETDENKLLHKTNVNNLDVITSGVIPPNPSELLDSPQLEILLNKLKKKYDVILFDTPPLIAVTDAFVLMKHSTQFILVIRAGVTERLALDRVMINVKQSGFKEAGVVLNALEESHAYGAGYYYNYYQYYYAENN
jgi:tyrosine-protein kinase Etk/Wzc